jgi:cadmium resistance protein CadD (predicted permease)
MTAAGLGAQVGIGAMAFASTNLDGLLLLMALHAHGGFSRRAIALGQSVGMGVLVLASLAGAAGASLAPVHWTPWLGLCPLALGVRALFAPATGPAGLGDASGPGGAGRMLTVAGLTAAAGGDNLGAYIPLFASTPGAIPLYLAVFALLTAVWILLARRLAASVLGRARIGLCARVILPLALTALGLRTLAGGIA